MEYLKTRRQLPPTAEAGATGLTKKAPSSLQLLRETLQRSGIQGLYSGCSALVLSNAAKGGVRFISFSQSQAYLERTKFGAANPGWSNVLAGLAAGATESVLVVTPGEVLKTRMIGGQRELAAAAAASGRQQRQNLAQVAASVVRSDGVRGLWSGLSPVLCKQGTNSAVRFATFGWLQHKLSEMWPGAGVGSTLLAGAASGVVTT